MIIQLERTYCEKVEQALRTFNSSHDHLAQIDLMQSPAVLDEVVRVREAAQALETFVGHYKVLRGLEIKTREPIRRGKLSQLVISLPVGYTALLKMLCYEGGRKVAGVDDNQVYEEGVPFEIGKGVTSTSLIATVSVAFGDLILAELAVDLPIENPMPKRERKPKIVPPVEGSSEQDVASPANGAASSDGTGLPVLATIPALVLDGTVVNDATGLPGVSADNGDSVNLLDKKIEAALSGAGGVHVD